MSAGCRPRRRRGDRRLEQPQGPRFARELDERIVQLHSKEYLYPSQIQEGGVLVVGAGTLARKSQSN